MNEEFYLNYLKSFIESKGLTFKELSKLCGFNNSLLTLIFKCRRRISIDTAFKLENALGLDAFTCVKKPSSFWANKLIS